MRKVLAITWKELYVRFTDRNLLIIMVLTPLALSTIIGLVFGGNNVSIEEIPVAIINTDQGNDYGINYGDIITGVFIPGESESLSVLPACELSNGEEASTTAADTTSLDELTDAVVFDAALAQSLIDSGEIDVPDNTDPGSQAYIEAAARAAVDQGLYTALIIIPPDFTAYVSSNIGSESAASIITIYANAGRTITAGIIHSIVEGIVNQILTGQITIETTFNEIAARYGEQAAIQSAYSMDFANLVSCAFSSDTNTIALDSQAISGSGGSTNVLASIGAAEAMFFALFTAQFGVLSMYDERENWTLQRLLVSPTRRSTILAGKFFGVFVSIVFQLLLLIVLLTLVGSIMQGQLVSIWGDNFLLVALTLLVASLAVAGFGMFMAAIAKNPEQGGFLGTAANMVMAALGGAFGFNLPRSVSMFSIVYWGREAFERLAAGQGDITLHLLVLLIQGTIMYVIGVWLFNRRIAV